MNAFNFDQSQILSFGKGLNVRFVGLKDLLVYNTIPTLNQTGKEAF